MAKVVVACWSRRAGFFVACVIIVFVFIISAATEKTVSTLADEIKSYRDTVVMIDPGHGGIDPGACSKNGDNEKELTLAIAKYLQELFQKAGMKALLTRDVDLDYSDDQHAGWPSRKRQDLDHRIELTERSKADLLLSIHANSFPDPIWSGAQTFHYEGREDDIRLACAIQASLVKDCGPNNRKAKAGDIYLLRKSPVPAVTIEVGFLSSPNEAQLLATDQYRLRLARAIYNGVLDYLKPSKQSDEPAGDGSIPSMADNRYNAIRYSDVKSDEVVLYFSGPTNFDDCLVPELRSISVDRTNTPTSELAREIVKQLARGPGERSILHRTIPGNTRVNSVWLKNGVLYVDLDSRLVKMFWGGSRPEELAIFSLVNSLTEIPSVKAVKLSIDGNDDISIGGHITLDKVFGRKEALMYTPQ